MSKSISLSFVVALVLYALISITACTAGKKGVTTPEVYKVFPPPPDTARIQYLTSINSSEDISGNQTRFNRYLFGKIEPTLLIKPYGIANSGSKIYICDTGIGGLVIMDLENGGFNQFIPEGKGALQFPINCAVDKENRLYVADGNRRQIVVFDEKGSYINAFGEKTELFKPTDVEVSSDKIYVSSISDHTVYIYDKSTYSLVKVLSGKSEQNSDYLYQPANIALFENEILVSDIGDYKIKVFLEDGTLLRTIGNFGAGYGQFTRPKGVVADRENNIYVVDAAFENVQIFNSQGQLLTYFGGPYKSPGDMLLPADISIDYTNIDHFKKYADPDFDIQYLIYVTNQYGPGKIGVYGFIKPRIK